MKFSTGCVVVSVAASVAARTLTVRNHCEFTVWPGIYTGDETGPTTGWEALPQSSKQISVPDTWNSGRVWGRRGCDFSKPEAQDCLLGACAGGLECQGTGTPPVTFADFALGQGDGSDFYNVWIEEGFGVPVKITPSASACHAPECGVDLAKNCPDALKGPFDIDGTPLGCKSACVANLDGDPNDSPSCCTGKYSSPSTCPASGVQFYDYFKSNCPDAYAYRFDDALWTCDKQQNSDYTVTFCPR